MARVASHEGIVGIGTGSRSRRFAWVRKAYKRLLWAAEAQAVSRIEREAGHLFARDELAAMKNDLMARWPW